MGGAGANVPHQSVLSRRAIALLSGSALVFASGPVLAQALPTGGSVSSGQAAISSSSGSSMLITQGSRTAIINWGSFSIGAGNSVRFENGAGATLNRVTGLSRSQIDGVLSATGSVYLVNPNGITVGPGGQVTTGGSFVASTHDVSDAAFHAGGAMTFRGSSKASVINYGTIGALGGDVALIARKVENAGTITAPNGTVGLAAGYEVLVRDAALSDGKFVVKVGGAHTEAKTSGVIKAAEVELKANGGNVYALAGNTHSLTKATGVASKGGRIFLTAGAGGTVTATQKMVARSTPTGGRAKGGEIRVSGGKVTIAGKLDARGEGDKGGTIVATAREIELAAGADLDVSGSAGGLVLVGGDYQGGKDAATKYLSETVANAETVTVAPGARIRADGTQGAGGQVVVWSDSHTSFQGSLSATGAGTAAGGDAEVSGKAVLDFRGTADLRSEGGSFGTLLLDPYDLTISAGTSSGMSGFDAGADNSILNVTTLTAALAGANVVVTTGSNGSQAGNITVATPIAWSANSVLTLTAADSILINADITATGATAGVALNFGGNYSLNNGARVTLSGASASFTTNGSAYTLIHDATGLQAMGTSGLYALGNDIDASATAGWNAGAGFAPIGTFTGTFTGLNHVIDGLTINRPSTDSVGLFGSATGVTISNVGLSNSRVTGRVGVGGLVGGLTGGLVRLAFSDGIISAQDNVGGLVGVVYDGGIVADSYTLGTVSGGTRVGGLVGLLNGTFSPVSISGSHSQASVAGTSQVGGLLGYALGSSSSAFVSNSYSVGSVTGSSNVGGLIGDARGSISNVYSTGRVSGSSSVGGLLGMGFASISNAYWDVDSSGTSNAVGAGSGTGITAIYRSSATPNAFAQATYAGFDFANTWYMIEGSTRPFLRSEYSTTITNAHQLQLMSMNLGASYTLGANIDLSVLQQPAQMWSSAGFSPVGSMATPFTGSLNGAGHTLADLYINRPSADYTGLFGAMGNATISNIGLLGGSVVGRGQVGGIAGYAGNSNLLQVYSNAAISGYNFTGGLLGESWIGSIVNSYVTGSVSALGSTGGIIGYAEATTLSGVYASGYVSGGVGGGLIGVFGYSPTLMNVYWDSQTTGRSTSVGGGVTLPGGTALTTAQLQGTLPAGFDPTVWGTGPGLYPYLKAFYGAGEVPVAISGMAYTDSGTTASKGAGVTVMAGGTQVGRATSGANGYYYVLSAPGFTDPGTGFLAYTSSSASYGGASSGLNLWGNTLRVATGATTNSAMQNALAGAYGSNTAVGTLLSGLANLDVSASGAFAVDTAVTRTGTVGIAAGGDLEVATTGTVQGGGNVTLSGSHFVNLRGADAVASTGGRWLVYLPGSTGNTYGDLDSANYAVWNRTLADGAVAQSGNRYVFAVQPTVTITADAATKTYGDAVAPTAYTLSGETAGVAGAYLGIDSGAFTAGPTLASTGGAAGADVGGYTITASGATTDLGFAITYGAGTLTVDPATLIVTADDGTLVYGDPVPTLGYGASGWKNGQTDSLLTGVSVTTDATSTSDVGTSYTTSASGGTLSGAATGNYVFSYVGGSLSVTARPLTIAADGQSMVYGDTVPGLTYVIGGGGLVNGDMLSGALATTASSTTGVGLYGITQGTLAASPNYALTYTGANVSVTARPLTITADGQSMVYGDTVPGLTYVIGGGLVNGDMLTGALATTASSTTGVGLYGITQGTLAASANYALSYTGANVSVTARPLTITADGQSMVYGETVPGLTYVIDGGGLVNGDMLTGALATTASSTTGVGLYAITQGTLGASANYSLGYNGANVSVTARPLTITADGQSMVYGETVPGLSYVIGGAGLANGDMLTGALATTASSTTGVGLYGITQGSLAASANYSLTYTGANVSVTARPLTITADGQSMVYGETVPGLSYVIGGAGLVNGDMLSGALVTSASSTTGIGLYGITQGSLTASANYGLTYTGANLSITPRPLSVTADNQSMVYGNAAPALTYVVGGAGLVNGDTLTGALATSAASTSDVGTYVIEQGALAASSNYAVGYGAGVVSVIPRAIAVAAINQQRPVGTANPVFTYTLGGLGLVNADALSGALASPADARSAMGQYPILQGTLAATANYALAYLPGVLTIIGDNQPGATTFVETTAPDQFIATLDTKDLVSLLYQPASPPVVAQCGASSGDPCGLLPTAANLPSGRWLSFRSQ
ncbi:MBG domain-containing protein [Roseixanthobacter liquoris]|uniref:MBG domain-containing protein n=1 Tax=Roseixanthobacter liquoris TaxID=3119921 RepID=UPI00372A2F3F